MLFGPFPFRRQKLLSTFERIRQKRKIHTALHGSIYYSGLQQLPNHLSVYYLMPPTVLLPPMTHPG
jgi:hypothetical protein